MNHKYTNSDIFKVTECPSDALLLSYAKGTISNDDKRLVELHLVDCEMCNDMVEGYQNMHPSEIDSNIKSIELKIDEAIAAHSLKKGSTSFKWFYAAAAVLIIGLTGILYNFYFNSLDQTKVADIPVLNKNVVPVSVDTAVKKSDNNLQTNLKSNETVIEEPTKSVVIESANKKTPIVAEDIALAESNMTDDVPRLIEEKNEEQPIAAFDADAELTTKSLSDNSALGNSTVAQPTFTPPNTESLSNGATVFFTSPSQNLNTVNIEPRDAKKLDFLNKKESAANAKYKAKKPSAAEKNEQEKDKQLESEVKENLDHSTSNLLSEANQLLQLKKYHEAIPKYNEYLKTESKNCEALNGVAACYENTNDLPKALSTYEKLSKQKCNKISDAAYLKQAELHLKTNQVDKAKNSLQKAMQSKYLDIAEQAKKELDKLK
jgi:hypothetical protein